MTSVQNLDETVAPSPDATGLIRFYEAQAAVGGRGEPVAPTRRHELSTDAHAGAAGAFEETRARYALGVSYRTCEHVERY